MTSSRTGVLGIFAHLDTTTDAIRRLRGEGYDDLTVYAPTPRHEVEEALERPESAVRIYTLMGTFAGSAAGAALAIWASMVWPLIVGGKEIVALPAFSIIIFELTVLIGALSTVAGFFLTSRLPQIGKEEGLYHPSFTRGNFGIYARVTRDRYDAVSAIMTESGTEEVLVDE